MINKEQLKEILKDLTEIGKGNVDNETIFREACNYQRFLMKNNQGNKEKVDSGASVSVGDEITPKQKAFLQKVGKYIDGMTKQEAFSIIAEMSKNKKNYKESKEYQNY